MSARELPSSCRAPSCRAPLMWVRTQAGKPLPLDPDPDPKAGTVVLSDDLTGQTFAEVLGPDAAAAASVRGERLYVPHFATCPEADTFRRPRTGART